MAKDFFDEEYNKKPEQAQRSQPWYIVCVCLGLVLCIALGWVLCTVFQGAAFSYSTDGNGASAYGADIIDSVIDYLKHKYYLDISEELWIEAIEYSGTALLQKAGDRYSHLMSPQKYYDFLHPTGESASEDIFGISFVVQSGVGLSVSSVVVNSGAYGKLQKGDVILKLTNIVDDDGNAPVVDGETYSTAVVGQLSTEIITELLSVTRRADFLVLRMDGAQSAEGFDVFTVTLTRQKITPIPSQYQYSFVEFYFDQTCNNVSMPSVGSSYSTYQERRLDLLPDDTGYVRITQFDSYVLTVDGKVVLDEDGKPETNSSSKEFAKVMKLFREKGLKHLVLDLKGNPGGNVSIVCEIAAMLVTDEKLSDETKALVRDNKGKLLITSIVMPKYNNTDLYYYKSSYSESFGTPQEKCSIAVWTDGGSASASELLTGALLDYKTAVQMGTTTYGKGIAQRWNALPFYGTVTNLEGKQEKFPWGIYFTCASYYSPLGNNIHTKGYTPADPYNNLANYDDLWRAAANYWSTSTVGQVG